MIFELDEVEIMYLVWGPVQMKPDNLAYSVMLYKLWTALLFKSCASHQHECTLAVPRNLSLTCPQGVLENSNILSMCVLHTTFITVISFRVWNERIFFFKPTVLIIKVKLYFHLLAYFNWELCFLLYLVIFFSFLVPEWIEIHVGLFNNEICTVRNGKINLI